MKTIRSILNRYRWNFIGVWSLLLTLCICSLLLLASFILTGCKYLSAQQPITASTDMSTIPPDSVNFFTLPEIPVMLVDPADRTEYFVSHYWDNLNPDASGLLTNADNLEQTFSNYLALCVHANLEVISSSIGNILEKSVSCQPMFDWFTDMFEKYLYLPNSPYRNEQQYRIVLEHIIGNPHVADAYKSRPLFQLEQLNKNRPGTIATNFSYLLPDDSKATLHGIKADRTLLFFYEPDCPDCKRTKEMLYNSEVVARLLNTGKLRILLLYPDEDISHWKASHSSLPSTWISGRDASPEFIIKNKLYAIRATPSLYLLDQHKRILQKDVTPEEIITELSNNP